MNLIRFRVILGIGAVLAGTSAWTAEPVRTPGTSAVFLDICPYCREAAQLRAAQAGAPLDPAVQRALIPPTSDPPTPRLPSRKPRARFLLPPAEPVEEPSPPTARPDSM